MLADDTVQLFQKSIAALDTGNVAEAELYGQRLLRVRPKDAAVLQLMAQIRLAVGLVQEAERFVSASLALRPNHGATLGLAGRTAWIAGDLALAEARLRQAHDGAPQSADAAFALCALQIEMGSDWQTLRDVLVLRFAVHGPGWVEIGRNLERKGQIAAALTAYEQAASTIDSAPLHSARGGLLHQQSRFELAETALNRALTLDPGFVPAWFKLGLVRQDQSDPTGAAAAYRRALDLRPDMAEAETNLGIVLQDSGDLVGAKRA